MAYLDKASLSKVGFLSLGCNVKISDKASIYGAERIAIGDNVRVDDFVVLSAGAGGIRIGRNVHLAVGATLIGAGSIIIGDFSNISSRVAIYSSSDDYSGEFMTNPTIPSDFTKVISRDVIIEKHVIIGAGSVIMPGVTMRDGVAVGALSFIKDDCEAFQIYGGVPAKAIKARKSHLLGMERRYLASRSAKMNRENS